MVGNCGLAVLGGDTGVELGGVVESSDCDRGAESVDIGAGEGEGGKESTKGLDGDGDGNDTDAVGCTALARGSVQNCTRAPAGICHASQGINASPVAGHVISLSPSLMP